MAKCDMKMPEDFLLKILVVHPFAQCRRGVAVSDCSHHVGDVGIDDIRCRFYPGPPLQKQRIRVMVTQLVDDKERSVKTIDLRLPVANTRT